MSNTSALTIEQRLKLTEDRLELLDLEGAYGREYDSRRAEQWAGLFTEDGIYEGRQLEGMAPQNLVRGRQNLRDFCANEPLNGMHTMHMPHIALAGDEATGRVHFQFNASGTDSYGRRQFRAVSGYYDVAYVRTEDGWRIKRRVTTYLEAHHGSVYDYEPTAADLNDTSRVPEPDEPYADARKK